MANFEESDLQRSGHWDSRAKAGYEKLGWVSASNLLSKITKLADLQPGQVGVDAATGSGAVIDALSRAYYQNQLYGFDVSKGMLERREKPPLQNVSLFVADIYQLPLPDSSIDVMTARQVYHNLQEILDALREAHRVLRPGGRLIICEYTPFDQEVLDFEKPAWDIKEPGRNLWTPEQLRNDIAGYWIKAFNGGSVDLDVEILTQYSNRNWMRNSGLPVEKQNHVMDVYASASENIVRKTGLTFTAKGDSLMNRPFSHIVATK